MKFSVCLAKWPGPIPYFEAYREIAETVLYGLRRLGHGVILSEHQIESDRRNIIIGFHVIQPENLSSLPPETILYQLEQVEDFHRKFGCHVEDRPTVDLSRATTDVRARLIEEELAEYREAVSSGDVAQVADALSVRSSSSCFRSP